MNKKSLMISVITIVGVLCILVGSIAYYRVTVNGNIKGSTGNAVFNVTGFTNESTKEIVLKEGKLVPGDKGSFTLSLDATNSNVDMYVTLTIDRGTLPTNLKFYTTSDYKSELHKYYEFMDTSNQSKDVIIYWYWNPYISDEEDNEFINKTDVTATIKLDAVQISEYAMMKNGANYDTSANEYSGTEFWNDTYRPYIRMINFINDLSNLPVTCNDANLCFDVSYISTQSKKVYAYLIDSGLKDETETDENGNAIPLYNLYIVSEAPIFAPPDCSLMFANFESLEIINFNNNFNTSYATDMTGMFGAVVIGLGGNENFLFSSRMILVNYSGDNIYWDSVYGNQIINLDLSSFNTSNVTNIDGMFTGCGSLISLDISSFNTSKVTDMSYMFNMCSSLTSLDLSSFDTSSVINMYSMFAGCSSLANLDISSFTTSKVINMGDMFVGCSSLTSLDLSSFNTSKVTDMSLMFFACDSLTSIDLSDFNTSEVTNMGSMFNGCSSLTELDLSGFNTSKVADMNMMFSSCSKLTSLDLSSFNTSKVTNMIEMFYGCSSLTSLDLRNFNTSKVYDMNRMFNGCSKLTTSINIMNIGVTSYSYMFSNAATKEGAQITVNYIVDASTLVDKMIATKSTNSNVVKGVQI